MALKSDSSLFTINIISLSSIPLAHTYMNPTETNHLHIAQLLLHLLLSPNFSYLLAFFSQVALVREENGVGVDDLSSLLAI